MTGTKAFEDRIGKGQTPQQALSRQSIIEPPYAIKKVKLLQDWTADVAARIEHVSRGASADRPHFKYLAHDGYAYVELRKDIDGKPLKSRQVTLLDALNNSYSLEAKDIVARFYKGDTVEDTKDGKRVIIKQMKKIADSQLILMPVSEAREVEDVDSSEGLRKVSGMQIYRLRTTN